MAASDALPLTDVAAGVAYYQKVLGFKDLEGNRITFAQPFE